MLQFSFVTSSGTQFTINTVPFDGLINAHIVVVFYSNTYPVVYINNMVFYPNYNFPILASTSFYLGYGFDNPTSYGLVGSIDEFRVWNGALQPSDVANHYFAGPDQILGGE